MALIAPHVSVIITNCWNYGDLRSSRPSQASHYAAMSGAKSHPCSLYGHCDTPTLLDLQAASPCTQAWLLPQAVLDDKVAEAKKTIKVDTDPPGSSLPAGSEPEPMDCLDEERVPTMRQKRRR